MCFCARYFHDYPIGKKARLCSVLFVEKSQENCGNLCEIVWKAMNKLMWCLYMCLYTIVRVRIMYGI